MIPANRDKVDTDKLIVKTILRDSFLFPCFFSATSSHFGKFNLVGPPQSLLFPTTETALKLLKILPVGTSPSNMLKERFRFSSRGRLAKKPGICPEKLFRDRSSNCRPLRFDREGGMVPLKWLASKMSDSSIRQPLKVDGISPDMLFY